MTDLSILDPLALAVSASPWLSELKALPIHFTPPTINHFQRINNTFATIFSGAVYIFVANTPGTILLHVWPWWIFILLSAICVCILLGLLLAKKEDVNSGKSIWPVIIHSIIYFTIFCSITMGCGLVRLLENNVYLEGKSIDSKTGASVAGTIIELYNENDKLCLQVQADKHGRYKTLISKAQMSDINGWQLLAVSDKYKEKKILINDDIMLMNQWRRIVLTPNQVETK